ncbi:hypothetical protein Pan189_37430 [Stratiformator vulcanicus]|uniref:Uncharacterized protein n=1 Tax=Stratiformator vulcanicus TaxID=2527980 RepID=A0A517R615_9PLAN|nr:hypothetical protein Pan189_37430 [Stratiformator vulcanicus]
MVSGILRDHSAEPHREWYNNSQMIFISTTLHLSELEQECDRSAWHLSSTQKIKTGKQSFTLQIAFLMNT